jgi:TolA-binding protein
VFGLLAKMLMPRITKTLAERTEQIEGGLARSEEAQAEATHLLDQYREQLAEARHEAARLREEAREQGAQIIAEMREQAQAEARRITESAQAQIRPDRGRVAHRRGAAEPDGGQVPRRARGGRPVRRIAGPGAVTPPVRAENPESGRGGDERAGSE